jgi:phosphoribosyl-ATP pyrophosphohydrolase
MQPTDDILILRQLTEVVRARHAQRPAGSYTTQLFNGGPKAIGAKVVEEANELDEAARASACDPDAVIHEAADLVYHLIVLLVGHGLSLEDVGQELARRFGTSGLDEKASRGSD